MAKKFLMEQDKINRQWEFHSFVLKLLSYILKHNCFSFLRLPLPPGAGCCHGHLLCTGIRRPVPEWLGGESFFFEESLSQYLDQAICWFRYIDDILMIWTGKTNALELNTNRFNLKFTFEWHKDNISFLDFIQRCIKQTI